MKKVSLCNALRICAVAACVVLPVTGHATVVFSTLPPAGTPQAGIGQLVGIDSIGGSPAISNRFAATVAGRLTDIQLGLYLIAGGGSTATVTLNADNAGMIGALLATGTGTPTVDTASRVASTTPAFLDVAMSSALLAANTFYWVTVAAGSPPDNWLISTTPGTTVGGPNGSQNPFLYQFGVNVAGPTAVPEPMSIALVGLGLAGLAVGRRKRRV